VQGDGLGRQQGSAQFWQGGVLGAGDVHFTVQGTATADEEFVHGVGALNQII
jgi:hypothetical protein